jgi:hypothetical protein
VGAGFGNFGDSAGFEGFAGLGGSAGLGDFARFGGAAGLGDFASFRGWFEDFARFGCLAGFGGLAGFESLAGFEGLAAAAPGRLPGLVSFVHGGDGTEGFGVLEGGQVAGGDEATDGVLEAREGLGFGDAEVSGPGEVGVRCRRGFGGSLKVGGVGRNLEGALGGGGVAWGGYAGW